MESGYAKFKVIFIPMLAPRCDAKTAVICSNLFVLSRSDKKVRKYPCVGIKSKSTWKNLTPMPDSRKIFSIYLFLKSIYLIGRNFPNDLCYFKACFKYEKS